jgi:hypothetical protein
VIGCSIRNLNLLSQSWIEGGRMNLKWLGFILAFFGFVSILHYLVQASAVHDAYANLWFLPFGLLLFVVGEVMYDRG